jgi:Flp pilus assembly protein TadD
VQSKNQGVGIRRLVRKTFPTVVTLATLGGAFVAITNVAWVDRPGAIAVMQHAGQLYRDGHLGSSAAVLERGIAQYPDSAQLHFMLGNAYFREHKWLPAAGQYERSARLRPNHPDTFLSLGYADYQAGLDDRAVRAWHRAVDLSPNDALTHLSLGLGLIREQKIQDAQGELLIGMRLDPNWQNRLQLDVRFTPQMMQDIASVMSGRPSAVAESKRAALTQHETPESRTQSHELPEMRKTL